MAYFFSKNAPKDIIRLFIHLFKMNSSYKNESTAALFNEEKGGYKERNSM